VWHTEEVAGLREGVPVRPVRFADELHDAAISQQVANRRAHLERQFLNAAGIDDFESAEAARDLGQLTGGDAANLAEVGGVVVDVIAERAAAPHAGQAPQQQNLTRQFAGNHGIAVHTRPSCRGRPFRASHRGGPSEPPVEILAA
jgi:hypothetical protein